MSLKKNLKTGQAALEYFILLAIIGSITILSLATFDNDIRNITQARGGPFYRAVRAMLLEDD